MLGTLLTESEWHWECPNCTLKAISKRPNETPGHGCRGLKGLYVLMVPEGTNCKIESVERGDYVNGEVVTLDGEGKAIMSVVTTRDDGTDCAVFAPMANIDGRA